MSTPSLSAIVSIGTDILNATRDSVTDQALFQTGDVVTGQVESDRVESWQHIGFVSLPSNPVPGQAACQGVVWKRGDIDVCTNTRDIRGQAIAGNLKAGETCLYAGGTDGNAQARAVLKENGGITLMTTDDNTPTGRVVALTISPTGLTFTSPYGSFVLDATGFHLKTAAGPRIDMGGVSIPGIPSSLSGPLSAYCKITAPKVQVAGGIVELGVGPTYGTCLQAPSAGLAPAAPPTPVTTGPTSQCASIRVTTP